MAHSSQLPPDATERSFPSEEATLELVRRIKAGEQAAFSEMYERYHDEMLFAVRAHLGARLRSALESEDVLQSAVMDAMKAMPEFEPRGVGSLRHYLHTIVVNKIRARGRYFDADKRAGTQPLSDSRAGNMAAKPEEPSYINRGRFERLERSLLKLPADMRQVLVLRKVDGLPSVEVAATLGKTDSAVRQLYSRGLARLALMIGDERGDD